ncbi:sphingosine-1-phosphate phosphatase 2-like isoform X1 [Homalodisca vitripennis]|uniref:sphingosine-1-phosphate phosphatase 2-like isoform X1 n=1 Tax=Homalodisca vitripennis TaxID=197043 RepID=UPI001EEB457C|nr:sphingosine-1-phosphate phosphatase 2-like isoform X1 [Homalodisca vitripennis]
MVYVWGLIEYLKDPSLVLRFQRYFGVYSVSEARERKNKFQSKVVPGVQNNIVDGLDTNVIHLKQRTSSNSKTFKNNKPCVSVKSKENTSEVNGGINSSNLADDTFSSESDVEALPYVITIKFWYYLFLFGTYLGDEVFYASFIPFWFWNIDGAVGRRIVMVWTIIMYIGQGIKDVVCWPRPTSPPVFRLQKKWSLEHGMPSTHAMVGIAIPFSVIIYTMTRYQYPVALGLAVAVTWCAIISLSRIYLGMHSVLDVVVGLILAMLLMVPVVPIVDSLDVFLLTNRWSPLILITVTIPMIAYYPTTTHWTPTRGDTTTIVAFCVGIYIGAWTNYHQGAMAEPSLPPPYVIIWPSWAMCGTGALRTVIGLCSIVATVAVCKSAQHAVTRVFLGGDNTQHSRAKNVVELTCKYITYNLLGFNVLYLMPNTFNMLSIQRPTFYTEF